MLLFLGSSEASDGPRAWQNGPMTNAVAEAYLETYDRFTSWVASLSEEDLSTQVPACPDWSVKDLVGHLTGIAVELGSEDVRTGIADADSTARQVAEREDTSISEVLREWAEALPRLMEIVEAAGASLTALAIDIWTHEQDARNAVNQPGGRDGLGRAMALKSAIASDQAVSAVGLPPMQIHTGDKIWYLGKNAREVEPAVTLKVDPYEAARMLMGRRTYDEMRALEWKGDPEPYLTYLHRFTVPEQSLGE